MGLDYDFSGWATRHGVKCSDGRTIMPNAFKHHDGEVVPLIWNHNHSDPFSVVGNALLEARPEGIYTYGKFNDTPMGEHAKEAVRHGDVTTLSIYANHLKQSGGDVYHGSIREVSLVLAGANPEAHIENVVIHGDTDEAEAIIYSGEEIFLRHSDDFEKGENYMADYENKTVADVYADMSEEQQAVVDFLIDEAVEEAVGEVYDDIEMQHADMEASMEDMTVEEVFDTLNETQKNVVYYMLAQAAGEGEGEEMKHNAFDEFGYGFEGYEESAMSDVLMHSDEIFSDAKSYGSLRDSFLAHAAEYGVDHIDWLFPDYKNVTDKPTWIQREQTWVPKVMNSVHHVGFSRIKSMHADITADEARAKGYMKGNYKEEEVFTLLKRTTDPQTVYKKQKLDKDDIHDITDFDVVAWLKGEMRMMLDEELARAFLVGDGRSTASNDKIKEDHIRPIWTDHELYSIKYAMTVASDATEADKADLMIESAIRARKQYKGAGNPVLYTTEDELTEMLLLKNGIGERMYKSQDELATAMRVSAIVTVPVMEGLTRVVDGTTLTLCGIIVNLTDYSVGADKGGSVDMFEDFDIDYNQEKYLIETRCSGALTTPKSAIVLERKVAA